MTRTHAPFGQWPLLLGLLTFTLGAPRSAEAQTTTATTTGNLTVTLLKVDGKMYVEAEPKRPINAAQCDAKVDLTFRIAGLPGGTTNPSYIQVYAGDSDCNTTTRDEEENNSCVKLVTEDVTEEDPIIETFRLSTKDVCGSEGTRKLWFLGVDGNDSTKVAENFGTYSIVIDTKAPAAPTKVNAGSGESEIPISWSSGNDFDHFILVWDPNASSQGTKPTDAGSSDEDAGAAGPTECSSLVLMAGDELGAIAKDFPEGLKSKTLDSKAKSDKLGGGSIGSDLAAIGVIAVDLAGHASNVSNIDCLKVVPTFGFWDQYRKDGGTVETGCACSAPGQSNAIGAAWPVGLAFIGLLLRARRRRA